MSAAMNAAAIAVVAMCARVGAGSPSNIPLLAIVNATGPWVLPNPALPYPVGPNPGLSFAGANAGAVQKKSRARRQPPAPANKQGLLLGDIRAHVHVPAATANAQASVTAQIFWRR